MSNKQSNSLRYQVRVGDREIEVSLVSRRGNAISFEVAGERYDVELRRDVIAAPLSSTISPPSNIQPSIKAQVKSDPLICAAPMPGVITKILVKIGQAVEQGQTLLIIEAMKMENAINAINNGTIQNILVKEGEEVRSTQPLISFK